MADFISSYPSTDFDGKMADIEGIKSGAIKTNANKIQDKPISTTAPTAGQVLAYDGAQWVGATTVASGSNANGTYTKFSDGTMICRIRRTVTDQAINTAYGSNYLGYRTWTFPIAFLDTTDLAITIGEAKWGTGAGWTGGASAVTATTCQLNFFESYSRASGTAFTYSVLAIGRWKA